MTMQGKRANGARFAKCRHQGGAAGPGVALAGLAASLLASPLQAQLDDPRLLGQFTSRLELESSHFNAQVYTQLQEQYPAFVTAVSLIFLMKQKFVQHS